MIMRGIKQSFLLPGMPCKTAAVALKVAGSPTGVAEAAAVVGSNVAECDGGGGGGVTLMASSP